MDMTPTNNFIATLTQTPQIATQLSNNFTQLKQTNDTLIQYLSYPQQVSDDLNKLYNALQTTSEVLNVVSVVPEVGEGAAAFNEAVTALMEEVQPAQQAAANLATEVQPLLSALQQLDSVLGDGVTAAQDVASGSTTFLNNFTAVVNCINSLPDSQPKETAQTYLNQFSDQANPDTTTLNNGMGDVNSAIDTLNSALANIESQLSPLSDIDNAINQVLSALSPIIDMLNQLQSDLMNIKISLPFPYPVQVSLYDIFNTLGNFISYAMAPIQDLVNQLLSALNISLTIPGLSDLLNINFNIPGIPDFGSLIQNITNFFNQFNIDINLFNLTCPPADGQTDFKTQVNGQ